MSGYTSGSIPSVLFIDNEAIRNFEHNGIKCGDGKYSDIECFPLKSHGDDTTESGYQVPPSIIDTFSGTPYQDYPNTIKQRYYPGDGLTIADMDKIYSDEPEEDETYRLDGKEAVVFDWDGTLTLFEGIAAPNPNQGRFDLDGIIMLYKQVGLLLPTFGSHSDDKQTLAELFFYDAAADKNGQDRIAFLQGLLDTCKDRGIEIFILTANGIPINGSKFFQDIFKIVFDYDLPLDHIISQQSFRIHKLDIITDVIIPMISETESDGSDNDYTESTILVSDDSDNDYTESTILVSDDSDNETPRKRQRVEPEKQVVSRRGGQRKPKNNKSKKNKPKKNKPKQTRKYKKNKSKQTRKYKKNKTKQTRKYKKNKTKKMKQSTK